MNQLLIANWKANKTIQETLQWMNQAKGPLENVRNVEIVICAPFTNLSTLKNYLVSSTLKAGAQNVSEHPNGAFTGEITSTMLEGLVNYCIVGHSERKKYYAENEEVICKKVELLLSSNITPILCVSDLEQMKKYLAANNICEKESERIVFVYEPPGAISGGGDFHPENPNSARENAAKILEVLGKKVRMLYGGSVSSKDIKEFLSQETFGGVLVGKASLQAEEFINLANLASEIMV